MKLQFATLLLSLICFVSACSNPVKDQFPPNGIEANNWSGKVESSSGYLHISGVLTPGATTLIQFSKGKQLTRQRPLVIAISDEDCTAGHRAQISYYADKLNILHEYSENEVPWNTPYELEAQWGDGVLRITLNGELRQIDKFMPFKHVKISSSQPVRIQNNHSASKPKLIAEQ